MRNVFDADINEKSIIEYSDFLNSILKSPTPSLSLDALKFPTSINIYKAFGDIKVQCKCV